MSSTDRTLFESLQKEFCHTIDSSLIAALLFDLESDVDGIPVTPTSDQVDSLRATLKELSVQADVCSTIEYSSDMDSALRKQTSSWTTPSSIGGDTSHLEADSFMDDSPVSGSSSSSSSTSFSSHLGFLQMVLPDVPHAKLRKALDTHDGEDLWDIIAFIVSEETIRETEERGLEGSNCDGEDETDWGVVQRKKKDPGMMKASKKRTPIKPKKFILADIRQQHHEQSKGQRPSHLISSPQPALSTVDFWTWASSLSSRLASLLPPHPPTTFSSFLHSPQYSTSYDAVRACLSSLSESNYLSDRQATILINLLDIIMPEQGELDIDIRSQIISDIELAVCVTEGQEDSALDLVYLLRDLNGPGMGLCRPHFSHGSPPSLSTCVPASGPSLPTGPPDIPSPPPLPPGKGHPPPKKPSLKTNIHHWQTVPYRTKPTHSVPHYVGSHASPYSRNVNGNKTTRHRFANDSNLGPSEEEVNNNGTRVRMRQAMAKSRQALMDATIMYQKHNSKNHGGEVAFFYAERAREWKQIAKREALNAAREMVLANNEKTGKRNVIDLHGTTVAEALVIVRELLNQRAGSISSENPLEIITGKGNHSAGRVGVLKPALRNALTEDGWIVTTWEAGLILRGRV